MRDESGTPPGMSGGDGGHPSDLIRADRLTLGYGSVPVLSSVRFRLRRGEVCGIRGANGSGKSTFLRACLGLLRPTAGTLRVLGCEPGSRGFRSVLGMIGYVPQGRPPGALRATVREVVGMGRAGRVGAGRALRAEDRNAVESALSAAGLSALAETPIQDLSGGQYQRANLARALAMEPAVFSLDEPTTHLDARGRQDVIAIIRILAERRSTGMLLVSHDPELLDLCDRIYEFGGGDAEEIRLPGRTAESVRGACG